MHGYDGAEVLAVSQRCARCGRPAPPDGGLAGWLLCGTCLRAADADIAAKRAILLPQAERNADALSTVC